MTERIEVSTGGDNTPNPDAPKAGEGVTTVTANETDIRPDGLPEKFESVEAMARSYAELETKLGGGEPKPKPEETPAGDDKTLTPEDLKIKPNETPKGFDMDAVTKEFAEKGELSDATYKSFEKSGFNRQIVDDYIQGQQALATQSTAELASLAGGTEGLQAVLGWAVEGLSESEVAAYNGALDSGDIPQAKLLMRGIIAAYNGAEGTDPNLVTGEGGGQRRSGATPFASQAQVTEAMRDPRYKTDQGYRDEVAKRLEATDF